ncbi:MAG: sigma-70 family RNA polymerase sigma factor [Flavobacteriales bacterium]|nr:sigma-70 family RNA polymerase sigma factor [Flavobacteriales bacterium]
MMYMEMTASVRKERYFVPYRSIGVSSAPDPPWLGWLVGKTMDRRNSSALTLGRGAVRLTFPDGPAAAFSASDALLVKRCLDGEEVACTELFHRYYGQLMPICMRYATDADDAKDILQEGFLRIFGRLRSYNGSGHFSGWLKRVMVNAAINHYRANAKERINARYDEKPDYYHVAEEEEVEDRLSGVGVQDILVLVQRLTPGYRLVFNLFIMEGWGHEQIARELGISVGTSKSNLNRARAQLKEWLLEWQMEPTHRIGHGG